MRSSSPASIFVSVDRFVLRNPLLAIASTLPNMQKKEKDTRHEHKLMHIISVSKHSRDRNTETRK